MIESISELETIIEKYADENSNIPATSFHALAYELANKIVKGDKMATVLDTITLGEYADIGFSLKEDADHILELYFKEKCIARFNQSRVTPQILQEGCKNFVANTMRSL